MKIRSNAFYPILLLVMELGRFAGELFYLFLLMKQEGD